MRRGEERRDEERRVEIRRGERPSYVASMRTGKEIQHSTWLLI